MADIDYLPASDGTGDAALMHITSPRTALATIIQVDTVVGVPAFFIGTWGTLLASGFIDPTTKRDFFGHVNAGTLVIDKMASGNTDGGNTSGQVVVIKPNTASQNLVASSIKAGSAFPGLFSNFVEPTGGVWTITSGLIGQMSAGNVWLSGIRTAIAAIASHTFGASLDTYVDINPSTGVATYVPVANGAAEPAVTASSVRITKVITSGSAITTIDNSNYTQPINTEAVFGKPYDPVIRRQDFGFNYVVSGCVWSGDAYASTLLASMTAGVVYINGKRLIVNKVTGRAFTLSKDTYVDYQDNGDGTAKIVYTEVANNAASPAIPNSLTDATNIRNAIIVSGATNIASVGSVNQGQENIVLPIVSNTPYAVTDSLGNLICPRDPLRRIIGYRQMTTNFTMSSSVATLVGNSGGTLSVPVNVPLGRKIRVYVKAIGQSYANATGSCYVMIWDGVVGSGAQIGQATASSPTTSSVSGTYAESILTPTVAAKTFNASLQGDGAIVSTIYGAVAVPAHIVVELL